MDIEKMKIYHQEVHKKLEDIIGDKMQTTIGVSSDSKDITELKILYGLYNNFNSIFDISSDRVSSEILTPWMMLQMHNQLMTLHNENKTDIEITDSIDKISRYLFSDLFGDD